MTDQPRTTPPVLKERSIRDEIMYLIAQCGSDRGMLLDHLEAATLHRVSAARSEAQRALEEHLTYADEIAQGATHYSGCDNHAAGGGRGVCIRCRLEEAQREIEHLRIALRSLLTVDAKGWHCRACGHGGTPTTIGMHSKLKCLVAALGEQEGSP